MNRPLDFATACEQWHALVCRERDAILTEDWPALAVYQDQIESIRDRLNPLAEGANDPVVRLRISLLIRLEKQNSVLLEEAIQAIKPLLAQARTAQRQLKGVRACYVTPATAQWSEVS